jgi:hypothetical protein
MPHDVRIETYRGSRDKLRALFELAEDSAAELDSYIDAGSVLVAVSGAEVIGHLQLTGTDDPRQAEIKNMAVRETRQGQGQAAGSSNPPSASSQPNPSRYSWSRPPPRTSATSASTSGRASACGPSSGTPSRPPPDTSPACSSTASSYGTRYGWTGRSLRSYRWPRSSALSGRY